MKIRITKILGNRNFESVTTIIHTSAFASAGLALTSLIALPPGWTFQNHRPTFATYHGPNDSINYTELIAAQEPSETEIFTT